jgi:hypothetical protein
MKKAAGRALLAARSNFNGLRGVISQNITLLFIAVKTSDPRFRKLLQCSVKLAVF